MKRTARLPVLFGLLVTLCAAGCQSPYHADRGALFGGLTGAGVGALVGDAAGNAGAGAAIGAGLGALTGAAVGAEMDQMEAQNRALIEQQLGRQVAPGAVTMDDVVTMSRAGVDDELIVTHIQKNGMVAPPQTHDLIYLNEQGVSTRVVKAMQAPPPRPVRQATVVQSAPPPIILEEHHYGPPPYYWYPPYRYHRYHYRGHRRPGVSWGFSFSN